MIYGECESIAHITIWTYTFHTKPQQIANNKSKCGFMANVQSLFLFPQPARVGPAALPMHERREWKARREREKEKKAYN